MTFAIIQKNDQLMHHFDMKSGEPVETGLSVNDIYVSVFSVHASLEDAEKAIPSPHWYTTQEAHFPMDVEGSGVEDTGVVIFKRINLYIVEVAPGESLYRCMGEMG